VLVSVTVLDLKQPSFQDTSIFYLGNIYLLLADANGSHPSIPVPVMPPPLSPSNYIKWVNALWFLSLSISLTSAMLATILQQCARRYLRITQRPQYSPHDGARIRAFFARGVDLMRFSWMVEAIPTMIHISLFLFFSGLLLYLFNTSHFVFCAVVWWIAASAVAYLVITFMPIRRLDSPYHAPLSPLAFWVYAAISYLVVLVLPHLIWLKGKTLEHFQCLADKYLAACSHQGMDKMAELDAREQSPDIDSFILKWTFEAHSLASDYQLDKFFEGFLAFYDSVRTVPDQQRRLATLGSGGFASALAAFLNRSLLSNSVSVSVKRAQFITCVKVADAIHVTALWDLLSLTAVQNVVQTVETGLSLRRRSRPDEEIGLCAQTIVADIIAKVQRRDDNDANWITLVVAQLDKPEDEIRRYLAHGDSVLLANLVHITSQIFKASSGITRDMAGDAASYILQLPYEFDVQNTLPELQHCFCDLWNEIIPIAKENGDSSVPHFILYMIRKIYIDLHYQGTGDPSTDPFDKFRVSMYPDCSNPDHRSSKRAGGTSLAAWHPANTTPHPRDPSSSSHVSDMQAITLSPVAPENPTPPVPSQHVDGVSTAPQHGEANIVSDPSLLLFTRSLLHEPPQ
jgi:hypothetical protein